MIGWLVRAISGKKRREEPELNVEEGEDYSEQRARRAEDALADFRCRAIREVAEFEVEHGNRVVDITKWRYDLIVLRDPLDVARAETIQERWPELIQGHTDRAAHESGFDDFSCPNCGRWIFFPLD
ncbi:hypothetical protein [Maricaulis sp.]|uniref:hypothetical protein n=1 Tax=Maricaulis sp. TaxID=1486257 RepID=UPI001AFF1040|nr:hypothetical protein [Maricaulis sp.]MBO6797449.1 hypothetical protein [Maricaulis sp.]